jgi:hypothetical protein
MSGVQSRPGWLFLLRPKWLCWHLFAVVAVLGMLWLGRWQLHRAESGNELSWAYTFEWPLFAAFGVYFWARTIRDELRAAGGPGSTHRVAGRRLAHRALGRAIGAAGSLSADAVSADAVSADTGQAETGQAETGETAEEYFARLQAEVRRHGRWHGLR